MMQLRTWKRSSLLLFISGLPLFAQIVPGRYTLMLADAPVAGRYAGRAGRRSAAASAYRQQIRARQQALIGQLSARGVQVAGSASELINAVFVTAAPGRLSELAALPGVRAVKPMRRFKPTMNAAAQVINAGAAWNRLGGTANAGMGVKIGIIDSGIDQAHPAFAHSDLPMPAGYPICTAGHPEDCAYTNPKVIVARSYVRQLAVAAVTDTANPAAESQPDDYSPRDRMGHGTAVASAAAGESNAGTVTFTGIAPKAWLGNYKIGGSPGVNDGPTDDVLIRALEDALDDGMDIVNISWGSFALGDWAGDPVAAAFENATAAGLAIVAAAGNEGDAGDAYPLYASVSSPANAPSVISVGASTNSHQFSPSVSVASGSAPASVRNLAAAAGSSTFYPSAVGANMAPLVDVTQPPIGNDGLACSPLVAGTLTGAFALIQRGSCSFAQKASNAQDAGAAGIVFYMADGSSPFPPLADFLGPVVMISLSDGEALKTYIDANPGAPVVIDLAGIETPSDANYLASFSSRGPTPDGLLKPDLVSVGTGLYLAVQDYDPRGFLYSANGYGAGDGTSFASPITAGAAALVRQAHPAWSPAQVRSALINAATPTVTAEDFFGDPVDVRSTGAGLLDAGGAVSTAVIADPATVSFGNFSAGPLSQSKAIKLTNIGAGAITLTAAVTGSSQPAGVTVAVTPESAPLAPGASAAFTVSLSGSAETLPAGAYSGVVTFASGSAVSLRVPYLYLVTANVASQFMMFNSILQGLPGADAGALIAQVTDENGAPVPYLNVTFAAAASSRGRLTLKGPEGALACSPASSTMSIACPTDRYGVAYAEVVLGPETGDYEVYITGGDSSSSGYIYVMPQPAIMAACDAAAYQTTVAPGSYMALFGSHLIDTELWDSTSADTARLPMSLGDVNVSFDATVNGTAVSYPGRLVYVSETQVNLQVPWELQGVSEAKVKVILDEAYGPPSIYGNVFTLKLNDYAPAFFENGGIAAALDLGNGMITSNHPASRGSVIQLFANGLGPVTHQPSSGDPATSSALSWTTTTPTVTIAGQNAEVLFSGLAPGFAGLYQLNVRVPPDTPAGTPSITVSIGGQTSKPSILPIQ